jgi:acetate kinase
MQFLAINCGSSSVKYALFDGNLQRLGGGMFEETAQTAMPKVMTALGGAGEVTAVGHRIVHGGRNFSTPVRITPQIRRDIEDLTELAPEHQPHHVAGIDAITKALPHVPQFACFDTAFHRTMPRERQEMALPQTYAAQGLLRYGFHGLSYEYINSVFQRPKTIICHLGNGCSLVSTQNGKSVYTSMGFTPLDGLMMGTRAGSMDPGAVLWLVEKMGSAEVVRQLLNKQSGLKGVSGLSQDMRQLLASKEDAAKFAITMFVDRLVLEIGKAATALQGFDALVFTGGIGENSAPVRAGVLIKLHWLGLELDPKANLANAPIITTPASQRNAHVIKTDEELVIAKSVKAMLGSGYSSGNTSR